MIHSGARPLASICIPTYQGGAWIRETILSAMSQDYPNLEVVVCDDASTDTTIEQVIATDDVRLRIIRSARRLGMAANWNRCIQAARGEYIKLLMQDDLLEPDCVSTMAEILDRRPNVGLVFSPRKILLDDPVDARATMWKARYRNLHESLGTLDEVNDGRRLFGVMRQARFGMNCFGEPSAVMVRRRAFERVGLFSERMPQLLDEEMWLRLAYFSDVGFVPRPLVSIRVHGATATSRNEQEGAAWLDRVWLLAGLRQHPELRSQIPLRTEFRAFAHSVFSEVKRARRFGRAGGTRYLRDVREYLGFKLSRFQPRLHEQLTALDHGE